MAKPRRVAILVRLSPETYSEFEKWRKKLGQDKSGFAGLCIQAGIKSVVRGVSPEDAMDPKTMANVISLIAKAQGVSLKKALAGPVRR